MAVQIQFRRNTTAAHATFAGAAGEITVDTTKWTAVVHDGTTDGGYPLALESAVSLLDYIRTKSISIPTPPSSTDITLFRAHAAYTITAIEAVCVGSTPSVSWSLRKDADRSQTGTEVVTGGTTTTSTSGQTITVFDSANVADGSWVWLELGSVTGTVSEFHLTIYLQQTAL